MVVTGSDVPGGDSSAMYNCSGLYPLDLRGDRASGQDNTSIHSYDDVKCYLQGGKGIGMTFLCTCLFRIIADNSH